MNYTMKQFLCSCCIFSILAVCVSCSKETLNIPDNDTNPVIMNEVESGEVFAKILATSLKDNPDLASFIKTKTMEAFDGDNNFLIIPNFVYYDHDNLTEYNTGSVKFDVEIR